MKLNYHEMRTVKVTAYARPFDALLKSAFVKFASHYSFEKRRGIKKKEMSWLTGAEYASFHNLRYFGVIAKEEGSSEWHLTPLGMDFFAGHSPIISPAGHMAKQRLGVNHPAWNTLTGGVRHELRITDQVPVRSKQTVDFQEEKWSDTLFDLPDTQ